jgi:hypothetical protein
MPKRKDGVIDSEVVKIRLPVDVLDECRYARLDGAHRHTAESVFLGYLVELGIKRYKNAILPIENAEDSKPPRQETGHDAETQEASPTVAEVKRGLT